MNIRRLLSMLVGSRWFDSVEPDGEDTYRCLRCGEGYERPQENCSICGAEFVVPTEPK